MHHPIVRSTTASAPARWLAALTAPLSPQVESLAKATILDLSERAFVALLFGQFAYRTLSVFAITLNLQTLLLVVSEVLAIALIMCRRPTATLSDRPGDWALGLLGVCAPLLATPIAPSAIASAQICTVVMLAGMCFQISAKACLWTSFGIVAANRGVKVQGPYRFVRHPMYAGYVVTHIGFLLAFPSAKNALVYAAALTIQIFRLLREERVLKQDPAYLAYADRVRYRLLPGVF